MMPRDDIEELQKRIKVLEQVGEMKQTLIDRTVEEEGKLRDNCKILAKKLLSVKPELEEWIKVNFGEYL